MAALHYRAVPGERQLNLPAAVALWAGIGFFFAIYGTWLGFGGRRFSIALAVFALFLAGQLFWAAAGVQDRAARWSESRAVSLATYRHATGLAWALAPLLGYLVYAVGTHSFSAAGPGMATAYALAPTLLLFVARRRRHRWDWPEYATILLIWLPVKFRWLWPLWPYPNARLSHTLAQLFAVNVAIAAFLAIRRLEGIGYSIAWGRRWGEAVGLNFLFFAAIAIPLGQAIGFITPELSLARLKTVPLAALTIWLFTAWPEEFLFRGLLQNLLSRTLGRAQRAWVVASLIFGLAHISNGPFPNWRYALLAAIAGLFYGRAWMKTGSIFASSLVHALVDLVWHAFFRTL
jgi:membrane protease YdiL (CAAX protease family)